MKPALTPRVEAEMVMLQAIALARQNIVANHGLFIDCSVSRSHRRDIANQLAKKYNALLDKFDLDGMHIEPVKLEDVA